MFFHDLEKQSRPESFQNSTTTILVWRGQLAIVWMILLHFVRIWIGDWEHSGQKTIESAKLSKEARHSTNNKHHGNKQSNTIHPVKISKPKLSNKLLKEVPVVFKGAKCPLGSFWVPLACTELRRACFRQHSSPVHVSNVWLLTCDFSYWHVLEKLRKQTRRP